MADAYAAVEARCPGCATALDPSLLVCPSCGALAHAAELKRLAAAAERHQAAGETSSALAAWRAALDLLPRSSRQHAVIAARVAALSDAVGRAGTTPPVPGAGGRPARWQGVGAAGAIGLGLLAKGKWLLFGLTKASTLWSMVLFFGVYFSLFGWKWALGLVVSLYIHEMGHVVALRRHGLAASPPMFIPGVGALVRLRQQLSSPAEDARVGLAGPVWGTAAAVGACTGAWLGHWPSWLAIAQAAAWLNLFNLLPLWSLDGGRAFNALGRGERALCAIACGAAFLVTQQPLLLLLAIAGAARAFGRPPARSTPSVAVEYVILVAILSYLASLPVH